MNYPLEDYQMSELKSRVGKSFSDNHSPTLNSRILKVGKTHTTVVSVKSMYHNRGEVGKVMKMTNRLAWNMIG